MKIVKNYLYTWTIIAVGTDAEAREVDEISKGVIFNDCVTFKIGYKTLSSSCTCINTR